MISTHVHSSNPCPVSHANFNKYYCKILLYEGQYSVHQGKGSQVLYGVQQGYVNDLVTLVNPPSLSKGCLKTQL